MDVMQNIALFREMMHCEGALYLWQFDADGRLLSSDCPDETVLGTAFSVFGCKDAMLEHLKTRATPVVLGTSLGTVWGAVFEPSNTGVRHAWVLGPVLYSELSMRQMEQGYALYNRLELSLAWKNQLMRAVQRLPCVPSSVFFRYLSMLHYCASGEHLTLTQSISTAMLPELVPIQPNKTTDRHKVYAAERALLDMVRNGDLNYAEALQTSSLLSSGVPVQGRDPLRQAKTSVTVFCTLVCRAAMPPTALAMPIFKAARTPMIWANWQSYRSPCTTILSGAYTNAAQTPPIPKPCSNVWITSSCILPAVSAPPI